MDGSLTGQGTIPERALVFDVGGTFMRAAAVDVRSGLLLGSDSARTPNFLSDGSLGVAALLDAVIGAMRELGERVLSGATPSSVVVGYPGPVTDSGMALRAPTILGPQLDCQHDVRSRVESSWPGVRVLVVNDLTCAGFSYVARGYGDFCVITVGSGIGSKVFIDGKPLVGARHCGGEIGHIRMMLRPGTPLGDDEDELGNIASGRGSVQVARRWLSASVIDREGPLCRDDVHKLSATMESEQLVEAFRAGDRIAETIVGAACYPLALAISCIHLAIGLETFFIVGGFAKALGERYRMLLANSIADVTWNVGQDWSQMISVGSEGVEEGLLGCAYLASRMPAASNSASVVQFQRKKHQTVSDRT